jgi:hypothetical protein
VIFARRQDARREEDGRHLLQLRPPGLRPVPPAAGAGQRCAGRRRDAGFRSKERRSEPAQQRQGPPLPQPLSAGRCAGSARPVDLEAAPGARLGRPGLARRRRALEAVQKIVTAAKGHARLGLMRRCPGMVASERHSGEDQGDSREYRRGDGLVEDQDAKHDGDHWQQIDDC